MTALDVAKYLVTKMIRDGHPCTNLQLQKLMYAVCEEGKKREKYIFFEEFEQRAFGPMIPSVYYHFCIWGAMPVMLTFDDVQVPESQKEIIDDVLQREWKAICRPFDTDT